MVTKGKVFVLLARGFEEIDVSTVTRTLRGLGLSVSVVGLTAGPVRGAYGLSLVPDCTLSEVGMELPQAAVLPGGVQAAVRLGAEPRVHALLRQVAEHRGYVMAIDAARTVLLSAGVLGVSAPRQGNGSVQEKTARWEEGQWAGMPALDEMVGLASEGVLVEKQVILSPDSGAAEEAALTLASLL